MFAPPGTICGVLLNRHGRVPRPRDDEEKTAHDDVCRILPGDGRSAKWPEKYRKRQDGNDFLSSAHMLSLVGSRQVRPNHV